MALIYVVEDDESIREIETIALKNSGHIVSAFECAKDFFKKIDEILPDESNSTVAPDNVFFFVTSIVDTANVVIVLDWLFKLPSTSSLFTNLMPDDASY